MRNLLTTAACTLAVVATFALGYPTTAEARTAAPASPGGAASSATITTFTKQLSGIVAVKSTLTEAQRRKSLLKALRTIEDRGFMYMPDKCHKKYKCDKWKDNRRRRGTYRRCLKRKKRCLRVAKYWQKRRERIVTAALKAEKATGVNATLMIALGRMESDFRPLQLIDARCGMKTQFGYRRSCGADCGITQHRLYGSAKYVRRMCKKFAKDYNLVFLKSAQEIARHITYCKKNAKRNMPLRRCILNRYNQGTFYKTRASCKKTYECNWRIRRSLFPSKDVWYRVYSDCKKRRRKCLNIAAYWAKLSCFEYGARNKIQTKFVRKGSKRRKSCRRCFRFKDIHKFYPAKPATPTPAPKPAKISSR